MVTNSEPSLGQDEARAEMVALSAGRLLAEDHLHVLEAAAVALEHELGARDAGAVLAVVARLGVGEIDDAAGGEVGRQQDVEQAALAAGGDLRHALQDGGESLPSLPTRRMRPGRSVTSSRPSGRKGMPHGCSSPLAKVSTLILLGLRRRRRIGDRRRLPAPSPRAANVASGADCEVALGLLAQSSGASPLDCLFAAFGAI